MLVNMNNYDLSKHPHALEIKRSAGLTIVSIWDEWQSFTYGPPRFSLGILLKEVQNWESSDGDKIYALLRLADNIELYNLKLKADYSMSALDICEYLLAAWSRYKRLSEFEIHNFARLLQDILQLSSADERVPNALEAEVALSRGRNVK